MVKRIQINEDPPTRHIRVLNQRVIKSFCRLILRGLPPDAACDYLGISSGVFWRWIRRGEKFLNGDGQPPEDALFGEFVRRYKRAFAKYRLNRIAKLHKSSQWVRELAILERRDRRSFGRYEPPGGTSDQYNPDEKFL